MTSSENNLSMAVFCDFENVALGVRDAEYDSFDIKPVLERLLLKGSIVVKKAYCNWDRYKPFKAAMHEANFELIEIPHVRQSGKNSADIRLVVDALDLCYTKAHVNTFVIVSGDSDFSPLVSKLRENAKKVIGVGVKQSTSDLLVANCDEFIFYDDLVRERQRNDARRGARGQGATKRTPNEDKRVPPVDDKRSDDKPRSKDDVEARRTRAIEIAVETFDALMSERGDSGKMWASVLKEAIKRRKPDFNESYFGFRTFGNLLEEAQSRGLLSFGRDDKSGAYVYRHVGERGAADELAADTNIAVALTNTAGEVTRATAQALNAANQGQSPQDDEPVTTRSRRSHHNTRARKKAPHESNGQGELPTAAAMPETSVRSTAQTSEQEQAHEAASAFPPAPIRIPSRARTAAALPPAPSAPGTILVMSDGAETEAKPAAKRPSRKPRMNAAAQADEGTTASHASRHTRAADAFADAPAAATAPQAQPAIRPRHTRKTTKADA